MRVMMLGDGVALTTGFARVLREIARTLIARGHEVGQVAALDLPPACDSRAYHAQGVTPFFPYPPDPVGYRVVEEACRRFAPDAMLICCDPGGAEVWLRVLDGRGLGWLPTVVYAPVEGAPISSHCAYPFRTATRALTATRWAADTLEAEHGITVPWVWHGVDTSVFRPLDTTERGFVRRRLGWEGRFVISYVARNAWRKGHDRLIAAVRTLVEAGMDDLLLYLHCAPFDGHQLQGWDLRAFAHYVGIPARVTFPDQHDGSRGIDEISVADRIAASDLYVSTSKVEGFGLPLLEAMACGTPVVIPGDQGNQEEVMGNAAAAIIRPGSGGFDTWFNGARLTVVDPAMVAGAVEGLRARPELLDVARAKGLRRVACFSWDVMGARIADTLEGLDVAANADSATPGEGCAQGVADGAGYSR